MALPFAQGGSEFLPALIMLVIARCNVAILETFSKRQKRLKGEVVDVFTYDEISHPLRVQICHIWRKCFGVNARDYIGRNPAYEHLHASLAEEFGMFNFPIFLDRHDTAIIDFFQAATTEQALNMIDYSFRHAILMHKDRAWAYMFQVQISSEEAISDLNKRFMERGLGYAFVEGEEPGLIRKDNEHLHKEVVLPALRLMHEQGFGGANEEYRKAHEHYLHGRKKECIAECLKAFESTMKTICSKKKWAYKETDTAKKLIEVCLRNELLSPFMQSHLGAIQSLLESSIPTVRNKLGGHGQDEDPIDVPQFYAEYLLHETATTIVFMVEAYKSLTESRIIISHNIVTTSGVQQQAIT